MGQVVAYRALCSRFRPEASNSLGLHKLVSVKYAFIEYFPYPFAENSDCWQSIKTEINSVLNPRTGGPDGSLIGVPGNGQSNALLFCFFNLFHPHLSLKFYIAFLFPFTR